LLREAERRRKVTLAKEQREFEEGERRAERDLQLNGRDLSGAGTGVGWADLQDRRPSSNSDESPGLPPLHTVPTQPNSIASRLTSISADPEKPEEDGPSSPQFLTGREAHERESTAPLVPSDVLDGGYPRGSSNSNTALQTNDAEGDALITQRTHAKRTRKWYQSTAVNMVLHPIQALIATVSFSSTWISGDPAAPLWDFIDDYAFPERVSRMSHPAGRSPMDPHRPKAQPGSLFEILSLAFRRIPHGLRVIGGEFFMQFDIPKAYLDSSVVDYPEAAANDDAFRVKHKRRSTRKKRSCERGLSDTSSANDSLLSDHNQHDLCPRNLPKDTIVRLHSDTDALSIHEGGMHRPGVSIHRARTFMPEINPTTGKPVAMQFQIHADELPHGTLMNRRFTDFSQPNMSRLPGILDSTRFAYLHPGMYGDLPSLWLPVPHLKRRKEQHQHRSPGQRLHSAMAGIGDAVEANIIGEKNVDKIHQRRERARDKWAARVRHPRVSALNERDRAASESPATSPGTSDSEGGEGRTSPPPINPQLASKCKALGFDASILRQCDPTGLHGLDLARQPTAESTLLSAYVSDASSVVTTDYDQVPNGDNLSGSESDNMDETASDLSAALRGLPPPVQNAARGMEEGRMP
ncbi:hypothetical protein EC988_005525, partial [Linderina pennispora]